MRLLCGVFEVRLVVLFQGLGGQQQRLIINMAINLQDIECVFESMSGRGSIYISNVAAAQNKATLHSRGIRAILSVTRSGLLHHSKEDIPHYLYIPAQDREDYLLNQHFTQSFNFIQQSRKQTNVLVHCIAGVSRSVTLVIAYLLKKYRFPLEQVISMIYRRRKKINPNKGFIEQLKKFAQSQGVKSSMGGNYLQILRGHSSSRNKRGSDSSREKIRKVVPIQPDKLKYTEEVINKANNVIQVQKKEVLPQAPPQFQMKKVISWDESTYFYAENEEQEIEKKLVDLSATSTTTFQMKKSMSVGEKEKLREKEKKRGLSIEEKIRKVRERILKKEEVGMQGFMKGNTRYSPIYKKSPKRLEDSSLERQNRLMKKDETSKPQISTPISNNENNMFKTFQTPPNPKGNLKPILNVDSVEKELFTDDLKLESATYVTPRRHHRWASKFTHQNYT